MPSDLVCRSDWYCLLTQWANPSTYLRHMRDEGRLPPQLEALRGVQQSPVHHPEGDALEHTIQVVDAMGDVLSREGITGDRRVVLMLAALCHDMGKAVSTKYDAERDKWTSHGHDLTGVPLAKDFLESVETFPQKICEILPLVRWHMAHTRKDFSQKAVRKLSRLLQPMTLRDLLLVMEADCRGRGKASSGLPPAVLNELVPIALDNGWMDGPHPADRLRPVPA